MSIPTEYVINLLEHLSSSHINNLITQTDARRILQEVKEDENNFPQFDSSLTQKATYIAYALISCGCSLIEHEDSNINEGLEVLEKAGKLLSDAFCFNDNELKTRDLHVLIASMSLYAARQKHLLLKNDLIQDIHIKRSHKHFTFNRLFFAYIRAAEQRQCGFSHDIPIKWGIVLASFGAIFAKCDIELPMKLVFNRPMLTDGICKALNTCQRCDEIPSFNAC